MSTALLAPPVGKRTSQSRLRRLEHVYPLFGFRRQVYRTPLLDRQGEIDAWLLRQDRLKLGEDWTARWERCQRQCPVFFKELWVVRLPRPSRSLVVGDYVFDPLTDFLHIPGSPPAVVQDGYQEAFAELPSHRFVYLDLLWDATPSGRKLLSVTRLQASLLEHEHQFRRRLRHDRLLIEAACARQREVMSKLTLRRDLLESIRMPATPAEARRILGLSADMLERSLRLQADAVEFTKFDPVIVFEEPALLKRSHGYMPLGLIAHWD